MDKHTALTIVTARVRLGLHFPIIAIPDWLDKECVDDLTGIGLISTESSSSSSRRTRLTKFGKEVLDKNIDIHLGILETVCSRFDLRWHGRVAAACIQTGKDIFVRANMAMSCGLMQRQVAHGHDTGFVNE